MTEKIKNLKVKVIVLSAIILLIISSLIWYFQRSFILIEVNPRVATISLDSKMIKLNKYGRVRKIVSPGEHTVIVEADGYFGFSQNYSFKRGIINNVEVSLREIGEQAKIADGNFLVKASENTIFYLGDNDSRIYRSIISLDDNNKVKTNIVPMTDSRIAGVKDVVWSPKYNLALFKKNDGVYLFDFTKYDFINQTETLWGQNIGSIAWAPDNSKIAYYSKSSTGENLLIFSNIANTEKTVIANMDNEGINDPVLYWSPDSSKLLIISRNKNVADNRMYIMDVSNRIIEPLVDTGGVVNALFSLDGQTVYYSTYSKEEENPIYTVLSSVKIDKTNVQFLGIRTILSYDDWIDNNSILAVVYNSQTNLYQIVNYDTQENLSFKVIPDDETGDYYSLFSVNSGNMVVYQSSSGIYSFGIKK